MDEEEPHQNSFLDAAAYHDQCVFRNKSDQLAGRVLGSQIPMVGGQVRQASSKGELCRSLQGRQRILDVRSITRYHVTL